MRSKALLLALAGLAGCAPAAGATWYVSAAAAAGGDGSMARPFATLAAVEHASGAGDSIIVLPSAAAVPPLDGGVALKPGQQLIGAGPAVIGRAPAGAAPRISNSSDARLAGDAVRLADGSAVDNLVIVTARRSAIYGRNVRDARIRRNDISDANTSCTPGLLPLKTGFAAVMLDFDASRTSLEIDDNFIHDSSCSDGIDVRLSATAEVISRIDGNVITRLKQGPALASLLGIGLQTQGSAALVVSSSHNAESYLGNLFARPPADAANAARPAGELEGADCKGLFTGQTGGTIVWNIERNTFAHGVGGTSCNGAEFLVGAGRAELHAIVRDSIFEDNPGDMIEENNLGTGAVMDVAFDNVTVRHATHAGPLQREPPVPPLAFGSFTSRGVCMSQLSVGAGAVTRFAMVRSQFADCAADGILALHGSLPGLGSGAGASSTVEIDQSSIVQVGGYALHWINYAALDELAISIQRSRLQGAADRPAVAADAAADGRVAQARIDLGGGTLGSLGLNCFTSLGMVAVGPWAGAVSAAANWWGAPPGAAAAGSLAPGTAAGDTSVPVAGRSGVAALDAPPPACQLPAT